MSPGKLQLGHEQHRPAKAYNVLRDLNRVENVVRGSIISDYRFIGSRVNGHGNWDAGLDVIVPFSA